MRPRAAIVVTGSELVRGERTDRNGPFLAGQLLLLGVDPARISIVGDDPGELGAALGIALDADLCVVSGGLGPTHDDRTVELVARPAGRSYGQRAVRGDRRRVAADRKSGAAAVHGLRAWGAKQATLPEGSFLGSSGRRRGSSWRRSARR